jgi:hypothetical protein
MQLWRRGWLGRNPIELRWQGRPHARGAGGPFGGIVAVVRFTCLLLWGSRKDAIDIYGHIDLKKLKEAYRACLPQLRI